MSHFSNNSEPKNIYSTDAPPSSPPNEKADFANGTAKYGSLGGSHSWKPGHLRSPSTPVRSTPSLIRVNHDSSPVADSPLSSADHRRTRGRSSSRPLSMVQAYQPHVMDVNEDTIPELQPIFTFLNSHANKLYQEGYFLKLDDQNTNGKPNPDRNWTECFAQLVGTVLSLWDAAELDAAGENGEVLPKFLNLTDASIKMIESLPTRSQDEQPLQNILSISTAGRNRYLLHFNSRHSLIQWTAGIRLAIFEQSTLQEAYTGALIAGKGKNLNNIGVIMERSKLPVDQWVRVRFGAGVPWRRCWCVVTPPDEKEYQKTMKDHKKKSPYDRSHPPTLKGDIKFYESKKEGKKQKKMQPIATLNDAYSAYALYPQAKSLIDASTLVKIEGNITIHSDPPSSTEGFVFIMPEVNPMVSGFEMMLRFLFPTWDTFGLYGRPGRLVASVLDSRSLMFAMPKHKRYGYLEILDVSSLILTDGSAGWNEREWRKKMKELTGTRMTAMDEGGDANFATRENRSDSQSKRLSFGQSGAAPPKGRVGFAENVPPPSLRNSRSMSLSSRPATRNDSAPPAAVRDRAPLVMAGIKSGHSRNASDPHLTGPPPLQAAIRNNHVAGPLPAESPDLPNNDAAATTERISSDDDQLDPPVRGFDGMRKLQTPEPVQPPPTFSHGPGSKPATRPYHSPEMRRANSRLSITTLTQIATAGGMSVREGVLNNEGDNVDGYRRDAPPQSLDQRGPLPVLDPASNAGVSANARFHEAMTDAPPQSPAMPPPDMGPSTVRSNSPMNQAYAPSPPYAAGGQGPGQRPRTPNSRPGIVSGNRPPPPPGQGPSMGPTSSKGNLRPGQRGPPPGMSLPGRGRGYPPPDMPPPGRGPPDMYRGSPGPQGQGRGGPLSPINSVGPIHRKPLPLRTDSLQSRTGKSDRTPPSSSGSLTGNRIDTAGLGQVRQQNMESRGIRQPAIQRQGTNSSSRYDDGSSTGSPDYASSRPSTETTSSVEQPRAGVLRTVGNNDNSSSQPGSSSFEIPNIDFGPTVNYAAVPPAMPPPSGNFSPGPHSHSPAAVPRKSPIPDTSYNHQAPDEQGRNDHARRSIIWQPAAVSPGAHNAGGLSAEEFVNQRAAAAAVTPQYAHQRNSSGMTLTGYRAGNATPPMRRSPSQDYLGIAHSRNNSQELLQRPNSRGAGDLLQRPDSREMLQRPSSRELLQRPGSRGAGAVLGGQGGAESLLSAREQEHVARVTGTPLINVAGSKNTQPTGGGLVGAIEAREREKQQMKQGWGSQAAQQAIYQRQQQQAQQQQQQQAYQQYQQPLPSPNLPPPAGMYSHMARGTPSPGQQGFGMPVGGPNPRFEQEGSWSPSRQGFRSPPPVANMDPRYRLPQQGQFSPPQGQFPPQQGQFSPHQGQLSPPPQQTPGRGQSPYGYHGQAF